jgi:hypothetical protein
MHPNNFTYPTNISQAYSGQIDEFRIWRKYRGPEDTESNSIVSFIGNEDGLYLYYRFDVPQNTIIDSSLNKMYFLAFSISYLK